MGIFVTGEPFMVLRWSLFSY